MLHFTKKDKQTTHTKVVTRKIGCFCTKKEVRTYNAVRYVFIKIIKRHFLIMVCLFYNLVENYFTVEGDNLLLYCQ